MEGALAIVALAAAGLGAVHLYDLTKRKRIVVYEHQWVLLYKKGQFEKILPTGEHHLRQKTYNWTIFDRRLSQLNILGQEVLSKDAMGLKLSTTIEYQIEDAHKLCSVANVTTEGDMQRYLHSIAQLPIREAVTAQNLEELIADRSGLADKIQSLLAPRFAALGIKLQSLGIRDLMLAKEVRDAFAGEMLARKQAAVLLEATRAETAALRSLANAARMLRENPEIMKLRVLQAMQSNAGKNTFVVDFAEGKTSPLVGEARNDAD